MFFFFQAEDGIRDWSVTGVQTCALPISPIDWEFVNGSPTFKGMPRSGQYREASAAQREGPFRRELALRKSSLGIIRIPILQLHLQSQGGPLENGSVG